MKTKVSKHVVKCLLLALISIFSFSSCATIFTKTKYPLLVNSNPDGATLVVTDKKGNDIYSGTTPASLVLKSSSGFFSGAEYHVRISLPGYNDKIVTVSSKIEGWYFGNLLLGGVLGMLIIDPASGAMWKLDTKQINVDLIPYSQTNNGFNLKIMDINDIPKEWKDHLVSIN